MAAIFDYSDSTNYSIDRDTIITEALELINILGSGESPSAADITSCSRSMELMLKSWVNMGIGLWLVDEAVLFLEDGVNKYSIYNDGNTPTGMSTIYRVGASGRRTTTSAAANSGQADIVTTEDISSHCVNSTTKIAVQLTDGTWQHATVSSISTTTITLDANLSAAVDSGATVYTFEERFAQSASERIYKPHNFIYRDETGDNDRPMQHISREEYYNNYGSKTSEGPVIDVWFQDSLKQQLLHVYPTSQDAKHTIRFQFQREIQDMDAATNEPAFPIEWADTITWNLAYRVSFKYGVPKDTQQLVGRMAEASLMNAMYFDTDEASLYLEPNFEGK